MCLFSQMQLQQSPLSFHFHLSFPIHLNHHVSPSIRIQCQAISAMDSSQARARMREEITLMESVDRKRRETSAPSITLSGAVDPQPEMDLASLPPCLPRPEDATSPGVMGYDYKELDFYVACEQGRLGEVAAYTSRLQPLNIVRQYGLEHASFGNKPAVARHLENGAGETRQRPIAGT